MSKRPALVLLLVVVAGVGAFLLWRGDDAAQLTPEPGFEAQTAGSDGADQIDARVEQASGAIDPIDEELPPDDFLRAEVEVEGDTDSRTVAIQVWQGRRGVPAPEAEVFVLDDLEERGLRWDELKGEFAPHWSGVAEERGRRYEADAAGRVEVDRVNGGAIVAAKLPGLYGFAWIEERRVEDTPVVLRADETVTVRVVDGAGRPARDVPVGIVQTVPFRLEREEMFARLRELQQGMARVRQMIEQNPEARERAAPRLQSMQAEAQKLRAVIGRVDGGPRARGDGRAANQRAARPRAQAEPGEYETRPELRARRHTDADGLAVFRHFQVYRNWSKPWWPPENVDRFQAVLLMPLQQPEARAFTGRPVSEDVIELRMPVTGSIALRTVDRDGRPFTHPVRASLRVDDQRSVPWSRVNVRKQQNEEVIVFPFVGLGMRFVAHCRLDDEDFRWRSPTFSGPVEPGERRTIDLLVAPGEGMLHGRLVDPAGRAIADEEVTFLINGEAGRLEGEEVLLDRDGRFHLPYQARPHHKPPFQLQIRRPEVAPIAGLTMPLESLPREQVTDLGELVLDGFGVAVRGTVVDDRGQPIPGAWLQLQRARNVGREQVRIEFTDEAFAHAKTDGDGNFALYGELERARYRLLVEAENHFEVTTPDLRPGESMRIELTRKSRLLGAVLRPEWLKPNNVRTRLVSVRDPEAVRQDRIHVHRGRAYVYFDWVPPGVYDLTLRIDHFPDPFLRVDRLVIEPGQMGLHPRLREIDLGAYLHRFEIFAIDEQGQAVNPRRPLLAQVNRPDGSGGYIGLPWLQQNRAELISTSPQAHVIPFAQGYASEPRTLAAGRSEIRFAKIPPVEVVLSGMKALAGTVNVQVILELLDAGNLPAELLAAGSNTRRIAGWYARAKFSAAMVDDDDVARLQLVREGLHKVVVRFGAGQGIRPSGVELGTAEIRIRPGSGAQRVIVSYDRKVVDQAIAEAALKIAASEQGGR